MDTLNSIGDTSATPSNPIDSGTEAEMERLFDYPVEKDERFINFDRAYYFSVLESGDANGFLPARLRNSNTAAPDYTTARNEALEFRYFGFTNRFDEYLSAVDVNSPVFAEISFLKEVTRKIFWQVYLDKPIVAAFTNEELAQYKELIARYLYENFNTALSDAKKKYPKAKERVLTDADEDALLDIVSKPDTEE